MAVATLSVLMAATVHVSRHVSAVARAHAHRTIPGHACTARVA